MKWAKSLPQTNSNMESWRTNRTRHLSHQDEMDSVENELNGGLDKN